MAGSPSSIPGAAWHDEYLKASDRAIRMERERDAAIAALNASLDYDEARFERIRYKCFGEVSERYAMWAPESLDREMEWAEERTGEAFRKLRDRVLGIPENV